jgi:hypothetical protein
MTPAPKNRIMIFGPKEDGTCDRLTIMWIGSRPWQLIWSAAE